MAQVGLTENTLALATALFIVACAAFSLHQTNPPNVVPASAPLTEFSAERALKHLEVIAKSPHPTGSQAHAEVRDYVLRELSAAGLNPEVQQTTSVNRNWGRMIQVGTVENIIARLPGTAHAGKTLLLSAHYDSRSHSFGANDNGAAVAGLLETVRALKSGEPLKNDLIFLFTDGEEDALLGAKAFASESPWAQNVGLAVNFEARGNTGPSIMFETSDENGWLIKEFARAAPAPVVSNSLAYEIYKLLPADTDLTVYKKSGWSGLNFAYINGSPHYHTQLDSLDKTDLRSLQHHGSYALALAQHFGNIELENQKAANAIYFDVFGWKLVHYSSRWVMPLTVLIAVLFIAVVIAGFRKKRLRVAGVALGFLAFLVLLVSLSFGLAFVWSQIGKSRSEFAAAPGGLYSGQLYLLGLAMLAVAGTSALYALCARKFNCESLTVGALLWWVLLLAGVSLYLPGGSYLLAWPLLFSLIGLGVTFWARETYSGKIWIVLILCAIPGIMFFVPLIYQTFNGLTLAWTSALIGMLVLLLGTLVPHLHIITRPQRFLFPSVLALVGLLLLVIGVSASRFDAQHPKQDTVFYGLLADSGTALWASNERQSDEWTSQFFGVQAGAGPMPGLFYADTFSPYMQSGAPSVNLPAPLVTLLEANTNNGVRALRLRVTSPRNAPVASIYVDSNTEMLRVLVNGKHIDDAADPGPFGRMNQWSMRYYALPKDGIEFYCETKSTGPIKLRVVDQSYELPAQTFRPRPDYIIPSSAWLTDSTFVSKSFVF